MRDVGRALVLPAVIAVFLGLVPAGCQGDYPIAPTACDRWCEAHKELECGYYSPAGCVATCESSGYSRPECAEVLAIATACYEAVEIPCDEDDPYFYFQGPYPCSEEESAVYNCAFDSSCPECQGGWR
jgi:hypothetical protein